jgi:hypothetical protein
MMSPMNVRVASLALLLSPLLLGCDDGTAPAPATLVTLRMGLDPQVPPGQEQYQCFLFDVGGARGAPVHALHWTPSSGPVLIHHAMSFATAATGAEGPVPCEPMPPPVAVLPLYAPGGEDTSLPEGVSIVIPATAASVFVEMHLIRVGAGQGSASVDLLASEAPPAHLAGWVDDFATVPPLPPRSFTTATAQCRFGGSVHVVASWPHMHRLGAQFEGTIVRAGGTRVPLLDVATWDFDHQPLYLVDGVLGVGDAVETACTWDNDTGQTVMAGAFSTDEMCNQGLVVWPQESAYCVR